MFVRELPVIAPTFLRAHPDGVILSLKVQPRASRNEVAGVLGAELKIKVTAPPVDSAANEMVSAFLAEWLGMPKGAIRLIRGQTSRHKQVLIVGWTIDGAVEFFRQRGMVN